MASLRSLSALTLVSLLVTLASSAPPVTDKEPFTLLDFVDNKFSTRSFKGTWIADSKLRFYNSTTRDVTVYDLKTSNNETLVPGHILAKFKDSSIDSYSKDGTLVAIAYETVKIFRHSTTSKYVIYDTGSKNLYPVHKDEQLRVLVWGAGKAVVWVKDNNVFYKRDVTSSNPDIQITSASRDDRIFNGVPDWVYEEEVLASGSAMWPSPDGTKLAFASFNDSLVNLAFYFKYGSPNTDDRPQYPTVVNISYPKAGTPNPIVRLMVVDLEQASKTGKPQIVDIPAPVEDVTTDHILYGCFWTSKRLLASWTNRVQNISLIMSCDPASGQCNKALSQSESWGWVDPPALRMHSSGRRAAAILPRDDFPHLAVVTFPDSDSGEAVTTFLTGGNFTVLEILAWDEKRAAMYYVQTVPEDPARRHVWRVQVPEEGGSNRVSDSAPYCITCNMRSPEGRPCQFAGASLSTDFTFGVLSCTGPDPAYYELHEMQHQDGPHFVRMLEANPEVRAKLKGKLRPEYLDEWFPIGDLHDFKARVRVLLPPGIDKSGATKYPLLVFVYAGPDSNQVSTAFSVAWGDYLSTSRNIVYALIDGRGSGRNGRRLMHSVYHRLGTVEIADQISVADQLKKKLPFVDPARTAIWGWSYGGFATAHAMAQDVAGVFCCGVSVAPVTSFIYYDTIYTERYMGLPTKADNLAGYNGTDVTRNVANFKHKKYLLIHGNADDNVHYQQSMELSRALEDSDIMFQQQSYPDEAHSLAGVKHHVYHTMDDFWTRAFKLPPPEWQNSADL